MLKRLSVKNFALISKLDIDFGERLNILSGETGAGKSIIVDCITLLRGGRYDKTMLRSGESDGYVEGVFELNKAIAQSFVDYLDADNEEIIITRKFNKEGKNEVRINGRNVTVSMLRAISPILIDVCGQNEHQSLANIANHIAFVDYYARHSTESLLIEIYEKYSILCEIKKKLHQIGDEQSQIMNLDIYKYQLSEIDNAKIKEGEEEELSSKLKIFYSAEKICSALKQIKNVLSDGYDGMSVNEQLNIANSTLSSLGGYNSKYIEWQQRLKSASIEIDDISDSVSEELSNFDFSENEIRQIEKRLDKIRLVTKKYGSGEKLKVFREELINKIDTIENAEIKRDELLLEKKKVVEKLYELSVKLSDIRKEYARKLENAVTEQFSHLAMEQAQFKVVFSALPDMERCESRLSANGMDEVEFYLCPNIGQQLQPLVKIISGGELSRLMLALKVVSSEYSQIPTIIFDEIDTGISGKVGQEIAKKLARLTSGHQLLCVTHLPQIASMADVHYFIDKYTENGQTYTRVQQLDEDKQIDEIARLSGSKDISTQSLDNARQMKTWSNEYKKQLCK